VSASPESIPNAAPGAPGVRRREPCADPGDPRRWKNAPLAQRVFILHNLMMKVGDRLVARHGMTSSRWLLLGALEQFDEPPTLTELCGNALLSVQNVSRMVASLEADGLVERYTLPGRGRSVFVRLTERGVTTLEEAEAEAERFAAALLCGFSETEVNCTEGRLERLIRNLESLDGELAGPGGDSPT